MFGGEVDVGLVFLLFDQLGNLAGGAAGDDKVAGGEDLGGFPPQGQPVAVDSHQGQNILLRLELDAGVDRLLVVLGHGVEGLFDHAFEGGLVDGEGLFPVDLGNGGKLGRVDADDGELGLFGGDGGEEVGIHRHADRIVGEFADDVGKEASREDDGAGLLDFSGDLGGDAEFQIVAREGDAVLPGLDEDPFQGGDVGLAGHCLLDIQHCLAEGLAVADEFHGNFLSVWKIEKIKIVVVVGGVKTVEKGNGACLCAA